jgi:hypothetical protein
MKCPADWESETGLKDFDYGPVEHNWYYAFAREAVAEEEGLICDIVDDILIDDDDPELPELVKNAEFRRPRVVERYFREGGRLAGLEFITASKFGKHFIAKMGRREIIRRIDQGPSLFFKDHNENDLQQAFWLWFLDFFYFCNSLYEYREILSDDRLIDHPRYRFWQSFLDDHSIRICFDVNGPVGASAGQETNFICFDVHMDAKRVHAYPVTGAEASKVMGEGNVVVTSTFLRS